MNRFARLAWLTAGITVFFVLWGAVVRATGSGAGCGNNWPTCNGDVLPLSGSAETAIEFGHRISSAGLGVLLKTQKRLVAGGSGLKIINVNNHIKDVFRYSGFNAIFDIEA